MALSTAQVRTLELAALGLPPNATADQINQRLARVTPGTLIDNRTGLPYTPATAKDAGSGQALGQIVGAAGLGVALGEIAAGLGRLGIATAGGDAAAAGGASAGGGSTAGGAGAGAGATATAANVFKAAKFASVAEFLSYMAWMLNPHSLLRAVEFLVGLLIGAWGIYLLTINRGSSAIGATARRIVHLTPAGRTIRVAQGRAMGRREGQREAARMEARQAETLSQREASARERVRINRDARSS